MIKEKQACAPNLILNISSTEHMILVEKIHAMEAPQFVWNPLRNGKCANHGIVQYQAT